MYISPIKLFTQYTSFRGEKYEMQPLSKEMREIFADKTIGNKRKRILWNLSEVPFFYDASRGMTRNDLLKLADLFERQDTNILQMAVDGDVKIATDGGMNLNMRRYLSFENVAKHNKTAPRERRINLYDYISSHPIFRVEKDAKEQYSKYNFYPQSIPYETVINENGRPVTRILDAQEAFYKAMMTGLLKGKVLNKEDTVIVFDKKIIGKHDAETRYRKINPEDIERPYPIRPETLKVIYDQSRLLPIEIMKSIYDFGESSFFPNLVKNTNPIHLLQMAQFDWEHNYLLSRMFNGQVTFDTINPDNNEQIHRPVIDIGRILKDRKEGKIKESDFVKILMENTLAFHVCALYRNFKQAFPDEEPIRIILRKKGEDFEQVILTRKKEMYTYLMSEKNALAEAFIKQLDVLPYRAMALNFDPE